MSGASIGALDSLTNNALYPGNREKLSSDSLVWFLEFCTLILDAGWFWAAIGFLSGVIFAKNWLFGLIAAWFGLSAATIAYFLTDGHFFDGMFNELSENCWWLGVSCLVGPLLGLVGFRAQRDDLLGSVCRMVIPLGALLQMVILPPGYIDTSNIAPDVAKTMLNSPAAFEARLVVVCSAFVVIALIGYRFVHKSKIAVPVTAI